MAKGMVDEKAMETGTNSEVQTSKASHNTVPNSVPKTRRKDKWYNIKGDLIGSCNAGYAIPVHFQWYTAGTPIRDLEFEQLIKRKTPVRPNMTALSLTKTTTFTPLNAVMEGAYLWESQNSNAFQEAITEMPRATVYTSRFNGERNSDIYPYKNKATTRTWLDIVLNSQQASSSNTQSPVNLTLIRAMKLNYNYIFRPKQDIAPYIEYRQNVPTPGEIASLELNSPENQIRRTTKKMTYTNSWRRELQVDGSLINTTFNQAEHTNWQAERAELLRQADNQEKSDIEILREFYHVKMPHENRPLIIGQETCRLDDTIIAQASTTAEANLGVDGAVTTVADKSKLVDGFHSNTSGWIITWYEFRTEPTPIGTRNRESFLNSYKDFFRKDLLAVKDDVMYAREALSIDISATEIIGYKRKYSELTRLPNTYIGEAVDTGDYSTSTPAKITSELKYWYTNQNSEASGTIDISKIDYSDDAIKNASLDQTEDFNKTTDQFWFIGTKQCRIGYEEDVARELEMKEWQEE